MTPQCCLIFNSNGFAWVHVHDSEGASLESDENPRSCFPTLFDAYVAAAKLGYRPTHWVAMSGTQIPLPLDQADHWRKLAGIED